MIAKPSDDVPQNKLNLTSKLIDAHPDIELTQGISYRRETHEKTT